MLIRVPQETVWVPYVDGPGRLLTVYTWHGLAPLRVLAHADAEAPVVLRLSRRMVREAHARVESDEPARLEYRDVVVELAPESPTEYSVSFEDGLVRRRIYRVNLQNALRPLC